MMSDLDVKQAVGLAKDYVNTLFADEGLINLGLEEVEYDGVRKQWHITLGFSRSWDVPELVGWPVPKMARSYKIVTVDEEGRVLSVKNREVADAG